MYTILQLYALLTSLFVIPVGEFLGWSDIFLPAGFVAALLHFKRITPGVFAVSTLLLAAVISLFQLIGDTQELTTSAVKTARLLGIVLPVYLVASTHLTAKLIDRLFWISWWGTAIALSASLIIYSMGIQLRENQQLMHSESTGEQIYRNGGLVGDSGVCGHLASIHFIFGFYLAFVSHSRHRMSTLLLIFLTVTTIGLSSAGILTSSSRSGLIAMLSFLLCYTTISFLNSARQLHSSTVWKFTSTVLALLVTASIIINFGENSELLESLLDRMNFFDADSLEVASAGRITTWNEISQRIIDELLFGVGYKQGLNALDNRAVDNVFLLIIFECGLLGVVALTISLYAFFATVFQLRLYDSNTAIFFLSLGLSQIAHGLTVDNLTMWSTAPLLFLLGAAVSSLSPPQNRESFSLNSI